jgi:CBS domain-containing protein
MIVCDDCGSKNLPGADNCDNCGVTLHHMSMPQPTGELMTRILEGTISDIKPRPAIEVKPETLVSEVIATMRDKHIGCALVVREGKVVGIMTERDLLFKVEGKRDPTKTKVKSVMRNEPVYLKSDDPVNFAFHHMTIGGYRHLPIYMADNSVGMISARDLLRYLSK